MLSKLTASLLILAGALGALSASPINYVFEFQETTNSGILPTASFQYDASLANPFSNFTATWDGIGTNGSKPFDFTNLANSGDDVNLNSACFNGQIGGQAAFAMLTNCPGAYWMGESYQGLTFLMFCAADGDVGIGGLIDDVTGPNDVIFGSSPIFGTFQIVDPPSSVPEPRTWLLVAAGLLLVWCWTDPWNVGRTLSRWRRRHTVRLRRKA